MSLSRFDTFEIFKNFKVILKVKKSTVTTVNDSDSLVILDEADYILLDNFLELSANFVIRLTAKTVVD